MISEYIGYKIREGRCADGPLYNMAVTDEPIIRCQFCEYPKKTQKNDKHPEPYKCTRLGIYMDNLDGFCSWAKSTEDVIPNAGAALKFISDSVNSENYYQFKCGCCGQDLTNLVSGEFNDDNTVKEITKSPSYCYRCGKPLYLDLHENPKPEKPEHELTEFFPVTPLGYHGDIDMYTSVCCKAATSDPNFCPECGNRSILLGHWHKDAPKRPKGTATCHSVFQDDEDGSYWGCDNCGFHFFTYNGVVPKWCSHCGIKFSDYGQSDS